MRKIITITVFMMIFALGCQKNTPSGPEPPEPTATITQTNTPVNTGTQTITVTYTATPTFSPTSTVTQTPTELPTGTNTPSPTFSCTGTESSTSSCTPTGTGTPTFTGTETSTGTFTHTLTPTRTVTPTATLTFSFTATLSTTVTPSLTAAITATSTSTFTSTATATCTYTEKYFYYDPGHYEGVTDTYIVEGADLVRSSCPALVVSGGPPKSRMLIRFDLSADIPTNAVVVFARLYLTIQTCNSEVLYGWMLQCPWSTSTGCNTVAGPADATWLNPWGPPGGGLGCVDTMPIFGPEYLFPVSDYPYWMDLNLDQVQEWVSDPAYYNWGIVIETDDITQAIFYSSENPVDMPVLWVQYYVP